MSDSPTENFSPIGCRWPSATSWVCRTAAFHGHPLHFDVGTIGREGGVVETAALASASDVVGTDESLVVWLRRPRTDLMKRLMAALRPAVSARR